MEKYKLLLLLVLCTSCVRDITPITEDKDIEYIVHFGDLLHVQAHQVLLVPGEDYSYKAFDNKGRMLCKIVVPDKVDIKSVELSEKEVSPYAYEDGYKRGQIDAQNNIIKYKRVTNDDGEVTFEKVN